MHFNGPQTKFIGDSLYKHPVDIILFGNCEAQAKGKQLKL